MFSLLSPKWCFASVHTMQLALTPKTHQILELIYSRHESSQELRFVFGVWIKQTCESERKREACIDHSNELEIRENRYALCQNCCC